jgi:hypothetical protein
LRRLSQKRQIGCLWEDVRQANFSMALSIDYFCGENVSKGNVKLVFEEEKNTTKSRTFCVRLQDWAGNP